MTKHHFSLTEFEDRQGRVRAKMAQDGLDLLLVFSPVNINWLIGAQTKSYQAFQCLFFPLDPAQPKTLTLKLGDAAEARDLSLADHVEGWNGLFAEDPVDRFAEIMRRNNWMNLRIGMELPDYYLSVRNYKKIMGKLGDAKVSDASSLIESLKVCKSAAEIAYVREAARIADVGITSLANTLAAGMTERQVAAVAHGDMMAAGGESPASPMNFVSGERSCYAHGAPTDRVLQQGDFMHIEFGGQYRKYCSTIARHFSIGQPGARALEIHKVLMEACDAVVDYIRPGVVGAEVHEVAASLIRKAGFGEFNLHTTGYGIAPGFPPSWGEGINMFHGNDFVVQPGMILSVEPPIFMAPEKVGGRLIDCVVVTDTGCEVLSAHSRDLIAV